MSAPCLIINLCKYSTLNTIRNVLKKTRLFTRKEQKRNYILSKIWRNCKECKRDFYAPHNHKPKRIILDCDMGTDDAIALFLLLLAEKVGHVKIEMIVCSRGNTSLCNVCKNVVRFLEYAKRTDIPVYKGSYEALLPTTEEEEYYHGIDGFGDLRHDREPDTSIIKSEPAFLAMRELILENNHDITLICTGPLTNLAILLRIYEDMAGKFKNIYIMGGNHKGIGNVHQAAEFNFYIDPEAAHIVLLCAQCPIFLLTWECCLKTNIPLTWRNSTLKEKAGKLWRLITKAEKFVYKGKEMWLPCDAFLVASFLFPEMIVVSKLRYADVELAGKLTRGQVALDHIGKKKPNAKVIQRIDAEFFKDLMHQSYCML